MFKNGGKTKGVHPPRAFANVSPTLLRSCAAVIARIDSGIIKVYSEVHTQPPRSRMSDTGAPKTCLSTIALEKFGFETSTASHINIKLGQRSVYAAIPDESCATYVRGLNTLGIDPLAAAPGSPTWCLSS